MVVVLAEDVVAKLGVIQDIDAAIPEEEFFVGGQEEGGVLVGSIGGFAGVMVGEVLVLGGVADLAQGPFII